MWLLWTFLFTIVERKRNIKSEANNYHYHWSVMAKEEAGVVGFWQVFLLSFIWNFITFVIIQILLWFVDPKPDYQKLWASSLGSFTAILIFFGFATILLYFWANHLEDNQWSVRTTTSILQFSKIPFLKSYAQRYLTGYTWPSVK